MKIPRNLLFVTSLLFSPPVMLLFPACSQPASSEWFFVNDFFLKEDADSAQTMTEFADYLAALGFEPSGPPSEEEARYGVSAETSRRAWFAREEEGGKIWLYADRGADIVKSGLKWEARGSEEQRESVERAAYQLALDINEWFEGRPEEYPLAGNYYQQQKAHFNGLLQQLDEER